MKQTRIDAVGMPISRADFLDEAAKLLRLAASGIADEFNGVDVKFAMRADPTTEEVSISVTRSLAQ